MISRSCLTASIVYFALVASGSAAFGQLSGDVSSAVASPPAISLRGEQIASWPADPWMTAAAERRIIEALQQEWTLPAISKEPLHQVVRMLQSSVGDIPLRIDERALEEIGMSAAVEVTFDRHPMRIGAALNKILRQLDLTFQISGGAVTITTPEAAEESLVIRLYDVTPLVESNEDDWYRLGDLVQYTVSPDTWEMLGGPSTLVPTPAGDRILFVIPTTTEVHFQVDALLNRMNQAGFSPASGVNRYRQPTSYRSGSSVPSSSRAPATNRRLPQFEG